jgi:hypothetical protein
MKKTILALAACSVASGCSPASTDQTISDDSIGQTQEAIDFAKTKSLTLKQDFRLQSLQTDAERIQDSNDYYDTALSAVGTTIRQAIPRLQDFIDFYTFDDDRSPGRPPRSAFRDANGQQVLGPEQVAFYYNRGDLGIGREMHCVENLNPVIAKNGGEIACYVQNFAAGDVGTEFQFGLSSEFAFINTLAQTPFATVGMVYSEVPPDGTLNGNKVFFVVYDANGNLTPAAALDRVSVLHGGTPGVNYNSHIPSNCMNCHGGSYNSDTKTGTGSLFLPFDTEQFEVRGDYADAFRIMNTMVWKVDARSGNSSHPVVEQLDAWYHHQATPGRDSRLEHLDNPFDTNAVIAGWNQNQSQRDFYNGVLRQSCRNCHMANPTIPFSSEAEFLNRASATDSRSVVGQICDYRMPDSLQTLRLFWQSSKPVLLENYLRNANLAAPANVLRGCGPGNVATLDPQLIMALQ